MSDSKRAAYLRGDITFHDYYGALVELLGENSLRNLLPTRKSSERRTPSEWHALIETDAHLNNVPLHHWDAADFVVRMLANRAGVDACMAITGSRSWSLSDSVCVLKETARRYAA
jgi:hypothetical protein